MVSRQTNRRRASSVSRAFLRRRSRLAAPRNPGTLKPLARAPPARLVVASRRVASRRASRAHLIMMYVRSVSKRPARTTARELLATAPPRCVRIATRRGAAAARCVAQAD